MPRAVFKLALLSLRIEDARPFPNFVRIDSPLLVYEEPEADESSFRQPRASRPRAAPRRVSIAA
jgi:hypothetical protein